MRQGRRSATPNVARHTARDNGEDAKRFLPTSRSGPPRLWASAASASEWAWICIRCAEEVSPWTCSPSIGGCSSSAV